MYVLNFVLSLLSAHSVLWNGAHQCSPSSIKYKRYIVNFSLTGFIMQRAKSHPYLSPLVFMLSRCTIRTLFYLLVLCVICYSLSLSFSLSADGLGLAGRFFTLYYSGGSSEDRECVPGSQDNGLISKQVRDHSILWYMYILYDQSAAFSSCSTFIF